MFIVEHMYVVCVRRILHMLFTLIVQLIIMRRFEKMLGWLRIIIIYTVCGMAANVFSAIFLPYFVTVRVLHAFTHSIKY